MEAIRVSCCCIWKDSDILFTHSSQCFSQEHRLTFSKLHYTRWVCACPHEQLCVWVHKFKYEWSESQRHKKAKNKKQKLKWQLVLVPHNSLYGFDCYLEQRMLEKIYSQGWFWHHIKTPLGPNVWEEKQCERQVSIIGFWMTPELLWEFQR